MSGWTPSAYLWHSEFLAGRDEGIKDRPSAIIATMRIGDDGETRVLVLPVTHSAPLSGVAVLEIPRTINDPSVSMPSALGSSSPNGTSLHGPALISGPCLATKMARLRTDHCHPGSSIACVTSLSPSSKLDAQSALSAPSDRYSCVQKRPFLQLLR